MPTLECPACGAVGDGGRSETSFDYLRRDGLVELRRCRRRGAGLLVRFLLFPPEAFAEVIPVEAWDEMVRAGATGLRAT